MLTMFNFLLDNKQTGSSQPAGITVNNTPNIPESLIIIGAIILIFLIIVCAIIFFCKKGN